MGATTGPEVSVLTPWYPSAQRPFMGAFVSAMAQATVAGCASLTIYHTDEWVHRPEIDEDKVTEALRVLLPRTTHGTKTASGATLVHLPVPLRAGLSCAEIAERHEMTLHLALGRRPLPTPIVHAHVGLPAGWAALRLARPDARVFVTEHASFLDKILAQDRARKMYDELLHRCAGFFAVSNSTRVLLATTFPHHHDRIAVIANPVAFDAPRAEPITELRRWLYVGNLIALKRVDILLEAFARCRADEPKLTLTYVGDGALRPSLMRRAVELGVEHAVRFVGAVPPEEALRLYRGHDLLVHPSSQETFGVSIVEALAAGIPVLVTRCGGPQETLAGIESAAGEMFDVTDDPNSIVSAYRRLLRRFPYGLDLARARAVLAARFSYPTVAAAYHQAWRNGRSPDDYAQVSGRTGVHV